MTFEELMQQHGADEEYGSIGWLCGEHWVSRHADHYEVRLDGGGDGDFYLYPRTLEALQAILESVDPIPEPPKPKTFSYEIEQSLGRVVIDRNSGVRGVITNARADGDRVVVDITTDHGVVTAVMQ